MYSRSASATGKGRNSSASISRNAEVQAPIASASDKNRRGRSHLLLHQLPPAEDGIGTQRIEPGDQSDVAALFAMAQGGAERAAGFGRIAALRDRFFEVRLAALRRSRGSNDRRERHLRCATTVTYHTVLKHDSPPKSPPASATLPPPSCFLPAAVNS